MSDFKRNRRIAVDYISRLVEEAMKEGRVPQPSAFGITGEDDTKSDLVYDWCQELIEALDETLLPQEKTQ